MTKIKNIETKEEWIKLILDGAKGVSELTSRDEYIEWNGCKFVHNTGGKVELHLHIKDFGIIEEVEEVELFEYIYKNLFGEWVTMWRLYTEEEIKVKLKDYEYRKTGRSFKVPKD